MYFNVDFIFLPCILPLMSVFCLSFRITMYDVFAVSVEILLPKKASVNNKSISNYSLGL